MPLERQDHWNPPDQEPWIRFIGKTRCGRVLSAVQWKPEARDASCRTCQYLVDKDMKKINK